MVQFKVNFKENVYFVMMLAISLGVYGTLLNVGDATFLKIIAYLLGFLFIKVMASAFFIGHLKGNAIKITENQFPDIFGILKSHSKQLELSEVPDMYLLQGDGILNAFATKFAGRDFVIVHSDILEAAYQEGREAVSFIIGHELGHIKRNHLGFIKSILIIPAKLVFFLDYAYSRACESTCDNIGYSLCPEGASKGILILAAGKKLYTKINIEELIANMENEWGFATWFAEIFSTHPALLKRVDAINKLNRDYVRSESLPPFVSPKVDVENQKEQ